MFALTGGPSQPEFESFTPVATSNMVSLTSGNFNYNIPLLDVGGYPLNLAYTSGQGVDAEASWVGLGWNMNVGRINRQVRGLPDDFKGDQLTYENEMRRNTTVGVHLKVQGAFSGLDIPITPGLGVQYNSYEGISWRPSLGLSFGLSNSVSVGFEVNGSTTGPSVTASVTHSKRLNDELSSDTGVNSSFGLALSSRKGLENMSFSMEVTKKTTEFVENPDWTWAKRKDESFFISESSYGVGGFSRALLSFNDVTYLPSKRAGLKKRKWYFEHRIWDRN